MFHFIPTSIVLYIFSVVSETFVSVPCLKRGKYDEKHRAFFLTMGIIGGRAGIPPGKAVSRLGIISILNKLL